MSGIRLEYSIDDQIAQAALEKLSHFNKQAMFEEIGAYLDSSVEIRFKDGIDPDGNQWQPSQRALNEGDNTLVDFGHLRDSITHAVFLDGSGVEHGSDMVYSAIHQFGGKAGRNHSVELVARPFIGINADDEDEIKGIRDDFLHEALNG